MRGVKGWETWTKWNIDKTDDTIDGAQLTTAVATVANAKKGRSLSKNPIANCRATRKVSISVYVQHETSYYWELGYMSQ